MILLVLIYRIKIYKKKKVRYMYVKVFKSNLYLLKCIFEL